MPLYTFESLDDGRLQDIFFTMKEVPRFGEYIDIDGTRWKRVMTIPNAASNTEADPHSVKDFNKSLDGKNVTIGNMFDASKEASEKRANKDGVDAVKQKFYRDYAKERKGTLHHGERKENMDKTMSEVKKQIKKTLGT